MSGKQTKTKKTIGQIFENFALLIILGILLCSCLSMVVQGFIVSLQKHDILAKSDIIGQKNVVDWAAKYPEREENAERYRVDLGNNLVEEDILETEVSEPPHPWRLWKIGIFFTKAEEPYIKLMDQLKKKVDESKTYIPMYYELSEFSGRIDKAMGKSYFDEHQDIFRLSNGQLTGVEEKYKIEDIKYQVSNIADMSIWTKKQGKEFIYIQYPYKESAFDYLLPEEYEDYSDLNADRILAFLEVAGVKSLDLREAFKAKNIDEDDIFFETDHHWNLKGGRMAAKLIAEWLNAEYGLELNTRLLSKENFYEKRYEDWSLGSYGRKVTLANAKPDDFIIYIPKYHTDFRVVNEDINLDITGSFNQVMVDYDRLEKKNYYENICYDTLLYGNRPLTRITNNTVHNGVKLLFIRDSFSLAMAPYLALMAEQVDLIDIRSNLGDFTGSVKTFVEEESPDFVIVMTDIGQYVFH